MKRIEEAKKKYARSQILRIMRTISDYKIYNMARILEVSDSYISQVETGNKTISDELVDKYLKYFKIERQDFDEVEERVVKILFEENVEMLEIVLLVVQMMLNAKKKFE